MGQSDLNALILLLNFKAKILESEKMNFKIKGYGINFSFFCYSSVYVGRFEVLEIYFFNHIYLVLICKMHENFGEPLIRKF